MSELRLDIRHDVTRATLEHLTVAPLSEGELAGYLVDIRLLEDRGTPALGEYVYATQDLAHIRVRPVEAEPDPTAPYGYDLAERPRQVAPVSPERTRAVPRTPGLTPEDVRAEYRGTLAVAHELALGETVGKPVRAHSDGYTDPFATARELSEEVSGGSR